MVIIKPQIRADESGIERLLEDAFGPDRLKKTAYRLREGVAPVKGLCFVAYEGEALRASLRFWPIQIRGAQEDQPKRPALLLGPLAVDPDRRGRNIGIELMQYGLERAKALGHKIVILVGDLDYYGRVGFSRELAGGLRLPGPVDQDRLLGIELEAGAMDGVAGFVEKWQGASPASDLTDLPMQSGGA